MSGARKHGWLRTTDGVAYAVVHQPAGDARGVVIVLPPVAYDYFHVARSLRYVADCLAAEGFVVIRVDLDGVGNAIGAQPDDASNWTRQIAELREVVCAAYSVSQVTWIGLGYGALLAAEAAIDEDPLVAWAPVARGRRWVRELQALAKVGGADPTADGFDSGGMRFSDTFSRSIAGQSFATLHSTGAGPVLLIARDDRDDARGLVDGWREGGRAVELLEHADFVDMICEPHNTTLPVAVIGAIVDWIKRIPATASPAGAIDPASSVVMETYRETSLLIDGLNAILTEPTEASAPSKSVLLLSNAGSVHSAGPNRLYVQLARRLAVLGVASVRFDLRNLGDSHVGAPTADENHPYPDSALDDVRSVVTWARDSSYQNVDVGGLCSGAFTAFSYAEQGIQPTPDAIWLINPLTFEWRDGLSLDIPPEHANIRQANHYQGAMKDRSRWLRLLRGDIEFGRLFRFAFSTTADKIRRVVRVATERIGLTAPPQLAQALHRIARQNTRTLCFFADSDPGYDILKTAGAHHLEKLQAAGDLQVVVIDGGDHTFKNRSPRNALVDAVCAAYTHGAQAR